MKPEEMSRGGKPLTVSILLRRVRRATRCAMDLDVFLIVPEIDFLEIPNFQAMCWRATTPGQTQTSDRMYGSMQWH